MPLYDYRCEAGHRWEQQQSIQAASVETCPQCGAPAQRVLHPPTIVFHGPGFHNTDYGSRTRPKRDPA